MKFELVRSSASLYHSRVQSFEPYRFDVQLHVGILNYNKGILKGENPRSVLLFLPLRKYMTVGKLPQTLGF